MKTYCPYCREDVGLICSECGELQTEENEYGFLSGSFECSNCKKKAQAQCSMCKGDLHMMIGR
jgi:hypothetical protein